jgi:hypothetical protein
MRNRFFAQPPKAVSWRCLPERLFHLVRSIAIQVAQVFVPFEAEPKTIPDFPEATQETNNGEATLKQCQWIFDQAEQRRNQLEQKAQSTFGLMVFLVPVLTSVFIYVVGKAKAGAFREVIIGLTCLAGLFLLLSFISAIRAIAVKSNQTLSLDLVIDSEGAFLPYDEVRHAKGLLYCASINTAKNDHLAQFVRGTHSMTAIAVMFVILAAIPTSFTVASRSEETARTTIVGTVLVSPAVPQSEQPTQADVVNLSERVRTLESRVISLESKQTNHSRSRQARQPE